MLRSRLSRRSEQKIKKNLILSVLGIFLTILFAFKFGIPLLVNLSLFLSGSRGKEDVKIQNPLFIASPVLNSIPEATASADIIISGIALKKQTINLYINGDLIDKSDTDDNGKFIFRETLVSGENTINAKAIVNQNESAYSNTITIVYKNALPSLKIISPSDAQSFTKDQNTVNVNGSTDTDVKVTVNGFWAITDTNGNFSYNLPLQNGENKIRITAADIAGNRKEIEIKVTYSP